MAHTAYIVSSDYTSYNGIPIAAASFDRIALRASETLDLMTFHEVRRAGLASFDADIQESIKLATCAIAEGLGQIDAATEGLGVLVSSEKVGSYSYTLDAGSMDKALQEAVDRAQGLLLYTGLLYRGV